MFTSFDHCFDFFDGVPRGAAHFGGEEGGELIFVGEDGGEEALGEFLTGGEGVGVAEGFEGGVGTGGEGGDASGSEGGTGG